VGALDIIASARTQSFMKKDDRGARLRRAAELVNLFCMEAEE